ncbi:MAG: HNH endonuclease [Candidatus Rokubacteria bacterium]|nr:HNH endonuclease [Candidatus Rokubacteria bacterium]
MDVASGYIALTDPDWYSYLSTQPRVEEVNFWQPHGGRVFRALKRGEPFFFKLRAPHRAISGFGFFERFESLPAWLAWDCFGEMNGAPDCESMIDRIIRLRGEGEPSSRAGDFQIGCIMLSAPVFFPQSEWVTPPSNWPQAGIQQGKTYPLDSGEGRRVLEDCLARAQSGARYWNVEPGTWVVAEGSARYGSPFLVRPRLGQGLFSLAVRDAYDGACAVTREHSAPVLEAAHIVPYARGGEHRVDNGLFLRRDLHRLYDRGYVTVTPDYVFRVGDRLRDDFRNGRSYYGLNNSTIAIPAYDAWRPRRDFLEQHAREVFKG